MSTEELEIILNGSDETQSLDFKESCPWDVNKFAKDILAMANVQDGGRIIIGVKEIGEGAFEREGILAKDKKTYDTDIIMDQLSNFADPYVKAKVSFKKDNNGQEYGILEVEPFKEIPVICKKDSIDTNKAEIYYRNRDGRVKSARVSNSFDMRDIIDRAIIRSTERYRKINFPLPNSGPKPKKIKLSGKLKIERGKL